MAATQVECVFFDCDDCLYKNNWATMDKITARASEYCTRVLGVPTGMDFELYKAYGTTLCGLVREGLLSDDRAEDFLQYAHDVSLDEIQPDPQLREMLKAIPHRRWVYTASIREHAERCLRRLGIEDLFCGIVSASSRDMIDRVGFATKHDPRCFAAAMEMAGVSREQAAGCVLLDDSATNLRTAKSMGWRTVLVGLHAKDGSRVVCSQADLEVATIHGVQKVMPELFVLPELEPKVGAQATCEVSSPETEHSSANETESTTADESLVQGAAETICSTDTGSSLKRKASMDKPDTLVSSPLRRVLRRVSTASTADTWPAEGGLAPTSP